MTDLFAAATAVTPDRPMAGVDEAGRGALAGPVVAAAVILQEPIAGLDDSKKLSAVVRERLAAQIKLCSVYAVASASVAEIESMNILRASLLAMQRAVAQLAVSPRQVLVDGRDAFPCEVSVVPVVGGDALWPEISAASILAKVERDHIMQSLHQHFPDYGFAKHKGYGTAQHLEALRRHGACCEHRRGYAPVRAVLAAIP